MNPFLFSTYNPRLSPNLQLWLDAQDSSSLTISGTNVSQWNDKGSQGHNATQATLVDQPSYGSTLINGKPGLSFPDGNRALYTYLALPQPWTIYIVGYDTTNGSTLIGGDGLLIFNYDGTNAGFYPANGGSIMPLGVITDKSHSLILIGESGVITAYRDGVILTSATSDATISSDVNIGSGSGQPNGGAFIGEVILFSHAHTPQEIITLTNYSSSKWNIPQFNPSSISNLALWLDASDSSTLVLNGSNVGQWNDKSGNNYNAYQSNGSLQFPLGVNDITGAQIINGNNSCGMAISGLNLTGDFTVFAVYAFTQGNTGAGWRVIGGLNANNFIVGPYVGGYTFYAGANGLTYGTLQLNQLRTTMGTCAGSTIGQYLNNTLQGTGTGFPPGMLGLGILGVASAGAGSDIAEIIIYNRVLSQGEYTTVYNYLDRKWSAP